MFEFLRTRRYSLGRSLIAALTLSWLTLVFQTCALGAAAVFPGQPDGAGHLLGHVACAQASMHFGGEADLLATHAPVCQVGMCLTLGTVTNIVVTEGVNVSRDLPGLVVAALVWPAMGQWSSPASTLRLYPPDYIPPQPALKFRVLLI